MKTITVKNADGIEIELEVSDEVYHLYIDDKHNEVEREKYRDKHLRTLTESCILENDMKHSVNNLNDIVHDKELMKKVEQVLRKCTPTQKRRFQMYFFKHMTIREIARIENRDVSSIFETIKAVRKKFGNFF